MNNAQNQPEWTNIKKGDQVVTNNGEVCTVLGRQDNTFILRPADGGARLAVHVLNVQAINATSR